VGDRPRGCTFSPRKGRELGFVWVSAAPQLRRRSH